MPDGINLYEMIVLFAGLVGVYVKLNNDINKLSIKQKAHESQTQEIKRDLEELLKAVQEIKLLLARKQLDTDK